MLTVDAAHARAGSALLTCQDNFRSTNTRIIKRGITKPAWRCWGSAHLMTKEGYADVEPGIQYALGHASPWGRCVLDGTKNKPGSNTTSAYPSLVIR